MLGPKRILDLGCGTGRLGYLASCHGAKEVIGVDVDRKALVQAKKWTSENGLIGFTFVNSPVEFLPLNGMAGQVDGVVMNPPFGTRRQHIDFVFLQQAFQTKAWVLSLHKSNKASLRKLERLAMTYSYELTTTDVISFPLRPTLPSHTKPIYEVSVMLCLFQPKE